MGCRRERERAALGGPIGVDRAIVAIKENAGAIRPLRQGKLTTIGRQLGVLLDEQVLVQPQPPGDTGDIVIAQQHMARPPATGAAMCAGEGIGESQEVPSGLSGRRGRRRSWLSATEP